MNEIQDMETLLMGFCRHIASAICAYVTCGSLLLILLSCELMRQRLLKWLVISGKICNKGIHQHLIFFRLWFSCLLFVSTLIARSTLSISQIYSLQTSNSNLKNCLRRFCEWVSLPVVILILRFSLNRASARKSRYGFYYLLAVFSYLLRMRTTISCSCFHIFYACAQPYLSWPGTSLLLSLLQSRDRHIFTTVEPCWLSHVLLWFLLLTVRMTLYLHVECRISV